MPQEDHSASSRIFYTIRAVTHLSRLISYVVNIWTWKRGCREMLEEGLHNLYYLQDNLLLRRKLKNEVGNIAWMRRRENERSSSRDVWKEECTWGDLSQIRGGFVIWVSILRSLIGCYECSGVICCLLLHVHSKVGWSILFWNIDNHIPGSRELKLRIILYAFYLYLKLNVKSAHCLMWCSFGINVCWT